MNDFTYLIDRGEATGPALGLLCPGATSLPEQRYADTLDWWASRTDADLAAMGGQLDRARQRGRDEGA